MADWTRHVLDKRQAAGGEHINVSTPAPPQNLGSDSAQDSSSSSTTVYIAVGIIIPLVLVGIGVLVFYICYRRRYPVRMVIGKDFSKFSNPAYNKRNSTLTLVKEDGEHFWDTFQPTGIQNPGLSLVPEEENYDSSNNAPENRDETDATVQIEHIEKMIENGGEGASKKPQTDSPEEDTTPDAKRERPRKAMLIKVDEFDDLESGFEMVSESDLEHQTESEKSSVNGSTDTHTIALSTANTSESSDVPESLSHGSSSDEKSQKDAADMASLNAVMAETNVEQIQLNLTEKEDNAEIDFELKTVTQNINNTNDESELRVANENNETENERTDTNDGRPADHKHLGTEEHFSVDDKSDSLSFEPIDTTSSDIDQEQNKLQTEDSKKSPRLTLSSEKIFLESVPKTPPVVVQDAIIFESESSSPVHLDNVRSSPRRQRRANTIECVSQNLTETRIDTVTKEWGSLDDIDSLTYSKESSRLFEPINKLKPISPTHTEPDQTNESSSFTVEYETDRTLGTSAVEFYNSEKVKTCAERDIENDSEDDISKIDEMIPFQVSPSQNLDFGSMSFEVINDGDSSNEQQLSNNISKNHEVPFKLSSHVASECDTNTFEVDTKEESDPVEKTDPFEFDKQTVVSSAVETNPALTFDVDDFAKVDSILENADSFQSDFVESETTHTASRPTTYDSEGSLLKVKNKQDTIAQPNKLLLSESKMVGETEAETSKSLELTDIDNSFSFEKIETSGLSELTATERGTQFEPTEVTLSSSKDVDELKTSKLEEAKLSLQSNQDSTDQSNNLRSIVPQMEENPSDSLGLTFDEKSISFEAVEGSNLSLLENQNMPNSVKPETLTLVDTSSNKEQSNGFSFLEALSGTEAETIANISNENHASTETFQQFEASLLNWSTPTSSAVNDPLMESTIENADLLDFFPPSLSEIENSTENNATDTSGSIRTDAAIDKPSVEDPFKRMISTESSSTHSWELVSEDGERSILENPESEKHSPNASDLLASFDMDTSDTNTDPNDVPVSFTDLLKGDVFKSSKDTPNDNESNDLLNFSKPAETSILSSSTGDGNSSWEVLDEDTEA